MCLRQKRGDVIIKLLIPVILIVICLLIHHYAIKQVKKRAFLTYQFNKMFTHAQKKQLAWFQIIEMSFHFSWLHIPLLILSIFNGLHSLYSLLLLTLYSVATIGLIILIIFSHRKYYDSFFIINRGFINTHNDDISYLESLIDYDIEDIPQQYKPFIKAYNTVFNRFAKTLFIVIIVQILTSILMYASTFA